MKSFKDFDEMVKKGSFVPYFLGEGEYEFVCRHANVPTDWSVAIGFLWQYCKGKDYDPEIIDLIRKSIIEMAKESAVGSWCALEVIYFLGYKEEYKKRGFDVITNELVENVRTEVIGHKEELKKETKWGGKNGLWTTALRTAKIIKKWCDIEIDLEET